MLVVVGGAERQGRRPEPGRLYAAEQANSFASEDARVRKSL
jgi:hypothetical protein